MWNFYNLITTYLLNENEILDDYIILACEPLHIFISKNPETFKTATINGSQTCMDVMFTLIGKLFQQFDGMETDEVDETCGVKLITTIIENVGGIEAQLPNILQYLVNQLTKSKSPDYKRSILTALCTSFNF